MRKPLSIPIYNRRYIYWTAKPDIGIVFAVSIAWKTGPRTEMREVNMDGSHGFSSLKSKQRALRDHFPEPMKLRTHRAISWIKRSEMCEGDDDAKFIFLWIAFNSAYADEIRFKDNNSTERRSFKTYFKKIVDLDIDHRISNALWKRFSGPVRLLMESPYTFKDFWQYHNGVSGFENWRNSFVNDKKKFITAFERNENVKVLVHVFDRLYTLRNQLVHGGSTWNSHVNRTQVKDGAEILGFLLPIFVDLMMDNPEDDWGMPFFPVVEDNA